MQRAKVECHPSGGDTKRKREDRLPPPPVSPIWLGWDYRPLFFILRQQTLACKVDFALFIDFHYAYKYLVPNIDNVFYLLHALVGEL
jgi:hypothetical protein